MTTDKNTGANSSGQTTANLGQDSVSTEIQSKASVETPERALVSVSFENAQLVARVDCWILGIAAFSVCIWYCIKFKRSSGLNHEIDSVTIKFGGLPEAVIKINRDTQKIAFAAYTELITRKIALPFDFEHDVIDDIYKSWYHVFPVTRELIKQIPAHHLSNSKDTRDLVEILINLLNLGLRPHLTKWHSKYRKWYEQATQAVENKDITPQEIQRKYPLYNELTSEIKLINLEFILLAKQLRELAEARKIS